MPQLSMFLGGADTFGFLIAALLFLRAYNRTRDVLFATFGAALALLAINQALYEIAWAQSAEWSWVFLIRLVAFSLLIVAIIHKNTNSSVSKG